MKPTLLYDLNTNERPCIATQNAATAEPCMHGFTWRCPRVVERYMFVTSSPTISDLMGKADPRAPP